MQGITGSPVRGTAAVVMKQETLVGGDNAVAIGQRLAGQLQPDAPGCTHDKNREIFGHFLRYHACW